MWQRFSENASRIVFYGQQQAARFGVITVGTEHLLLGLLQQAESATVWPPAPIDRIEAGDAAGFILREIGAEITALRTEVERLVTIGTLVPTTDMTLSPEGKKVIDLAFEEARLLRHAYIGPEHLLLGLVREENGIAGRVLRQSGVGLEAVRVVAAQLPPGSIVRTAEKTPRQKKRTVWQWLFESFLEV